MLKALLSESFPNAAIYSASNSVTGLELCVIEKPDVVLLDIVMPEMDGYKVCKKLKKNPETAIIPVIFITAARTDFESKVKALNSGGDAFLTKPVDPAELTAQIKSMLRIKKAEDEKRNENERLNLIDGLGLTSLMKQSPVFVVIK